MTDQIKKLLYIYIYKLRRKLMEYLLKFEYLFLT